MSGSKIADTGCVRLSDISPAPQADVDFTFRAPQSSDGPAIWQLIAACPPLDTNSLYCNLLQCTHFADTCIIAERDGEICGWISGYRLPQDSDSMFVWQVAVDASMRGKGLGKLMLNALFARPALQGVKRLLTTVTPSNLSSRRMFAGFAAQLGLTVDVSPYFESDAHLGGAHEAEELVSIGPIDISRIAA